MPVLGRYCYALACHEVATQEALGSAEEELLLVIQKTRRPMPAAFYLLGKVYIRLNRCAAGPRSGKTGARVVYCHCRF